MMADDKQQSTAGNWRKSKTVEGARTTRPVDHGNGQRTAITTTDEPDRWVDNGWEPS